MFISLISGSENLARLPPYQEIFASARGAATNIFTVINRKSKIDPMENKGEVLNYVDLKGNIEFKNVFFSYPSRPNVQVRIAKVIQLTDYFAKIFSIIRIE